MTKITLVTPSFNQAEFLERTIQSVLSQREYVHEYFILDGGSTDGSREIIHRYDSQIDWWISEKDQGQSDAIHRGFQKATGDVVGWLNSDDLLLPGALERVIKAFDSDPSLEVVSGYLALIDADDRIISLPRVPSGNSYLGKRGVIQISQQATFFRRSTYERVGGLDTSLHCAMDLDLWTRFLLAHAKWRSLPVFLAAFRKHDAAKGSGNVWWQKYQNEKRIVRSRYPSIFSSASRTREALAVYHLSQIFTGRYFISRAQSLKSYGNLVNEQFK